MLQLENEKVEKHLWKKWINTDNSPHFNPTLLSFMLITRNLQKQLISQSAQFNNKSQKTFMLVLLFLSEFWSRQSQGQGMGGNTHLFWPPGRKIGQQTLAAQP